MNLKFVLVVARLSGNALASINVVITLYM